jgi:YD repeat-containing protein
MASRTPLYWDGTDIKEMTATMINQIIDQTIYQYSLSPSVSLSVVASAGSLASMNDTRKQAGASSTSATSTPTEATTAEPGTVTVTYDKINQTTASTSAPTDTSSKAFPVYYDGAGNIQSMTLTDMNDTFFHPAIDLLTSGSTGTQQAGTYTITTSSAGAVSATPVFSDTRADTSLYTAAGIPETLDQPTTITNYYLHKVAGSDTAYTAPLYVNGTDLQTYTDANFESLIQTGVIHSATSDAGYTISYNINGTGNNRGTAMVDTILNGSGNYQTLFVNDDDYRAQEFPDGTAVTASTYYLRINKS